MPFVKNPLLVVNNELLCLESSHASGAGTGNGLSISLVLNISGSKETLDAGVCCARDGLDVAILVHVNLTLDECSGRVVADGVEQAAGLDSLLISGDGILDNEVAHETVLTALDLDGGAVESDCRLGVLEQALGHGLAGTEHVTADKHGNVAGVLCQEGSLLSGRIATTDNVEGFVAEDGDSAVADSAGRHAALPVLVLAGDVKTAGRGAGGDDDGLGGMSLVGGEFGGVLEGAGGKVKGGDGVGDDFGAESFGLLLHVFLATVSVSGTIREHKCNNREKLTMSSPPMIPVGKPGKFSTSVVVVN